LAAGKKLVFKRRDATRLFDYSVRVGMVRYPSSATIRVAPDSERRFSLMAANTPAHP
jgi:hypothetical protein